MCNMFLVICLLTVLLYAILRQLSLRAKLPPGPVPIPFLGNIPQVVYEIYRKGGILGGLKTYQEKYGDIFTLWLGPFPAVNIASFELAHEAMVKQGSHFADRFTGELIDYLSNHMGIFGTNGEPWKLQRKFALNTFRNFGVGRDLMEERIIAELEARYVEIESEESGGKIVLNATHFYDVTVASVINSILFSQRYKLRDQIYFKLRELLLEAQSALMPFDLVLPMWLLKTPLFKKRLNMFLNSQARLEDFLAERVQDRVKAIEAGEHEIGDKPKDYVDAFLKKIDEERTEGVKDTVFTIRSLSMNLMDLWQTGQDTTSLTLRSGTAQLLNHPEVVAKVREELLAVTDNGKRHLSLSDKTKTPYLNATIQEIQRHASILNINFWKMASQDTPVGKYTVPKGSWITVQHSLMHIDERVYKNSSEFYPERFIENESLNHEVVPFGIGKRSCIGESLARAELYLIFGNLLLRYDIRPHGGIPPTYDAEPNCVVKIAHDYNMQFVKLNH